MAVFGWEDGDGSVGMGVWGWDSGDGIVCMGAWGWEHGNGSVGMGAWGSEPFFCYFEVFLKIYLFHFFSLTEKSKWS